MASPAAHALPVLLLGLWLAACQPQGDAAIPSAGASEKVAVIDGQAIQQGELDAWIKEELFRSETEDGAAAALYELRSKALERMLDQRVLDAEAKRRGVSTDDVMRLEREERGPISDEEVTAFYTANAARMGSVTRDQAAERIRSYLDQKRGDVIMADLRKQAKIEILIEAPRLEVAAEGPSRGPADAPVTIVEFSDFQCPFCGRAGPVMNEVLARYPTQVRVVYRHLPLDSIHPHARPAAEASACADAQGRFWDYHDKLFANQRALAPENLQAYAKELSLDMAAFDQCVKERKFAELVDRDLAAATEAGRAAGKQGLGTPAFFVNGILLSGAKPAEEFYKVIDAELARAGTPAPAAAPPPVGS